MKNGENDGLKNRINRRDILKFSIAAGAALAAGGISGIASAADKENPLSDVEKPPENRPEHAKQRFLKSMNCSQAILETYAPSMGMTVEMARRVATAFAGGMGIGTECGCLTGAMMVIGLKHGRVRDEDTQAKNETYKRRAELLKEFKAIYKHIGCSELLQVDMGTPGGMREAGIRGYYTTRCPEYVKTTAEILEKIL